MGLIFKKIICSLFGHKYSYNFGWMPNKCYCTRCNAKWKTITNPDYKGNPIEEDIFIWVKKEDGE